MDDEAVVIPFDETWELVIASYRHNTVGNQRPVSLMHTATTDNSCSKDGVRTVRTVLYCLRQIRTKKGD
jgi:hypothetical protein